MIIMKVQTKHLHKCDALETLSLGFFLVFVSSDYVRSPARLSYAYYEQLCEPKIVPHPIIPTHFHRITKTLV